jgi:hypothetical protein
MPARTCPPPLSLSGSAMAHRITLRFLETHSATAYQGIHDTIVQ